MTTVSNDEFIQRLLNATTEEKIDWQPTAQGDEYTASFGGKWTLVCRRRRRMIVRGGESETIDVLLLKNLQGEELLRIDDDELITVTQLFVMARRHALKVNEAVADLLRELDEPQF